MLRLWVTLKSWDAVSLIVNTNTAGSGKCGEAPAQSHSGALGTGPTYIYSRASVHELTSLHNSGCKLQWSKSESHLPIRSILNLIH